MPPLSIAVVIAAVVAALSPASHGQGMASPPSSGLDCSKLASMPNPPISVAACEQMVRMQAEMMTALNTPGGERPGDDKLTCAQSIEEMKATRAAGVSPATASENKAAAEDMKTTMERAQAEAAALAAAQTARSAAAAAVPGNVAGQAAAPRILLPDGPRRIELRQTPVLGQSVDHRRPEIVATLTLRLRDQVRKRFGVSLEFVHVGPHNPIARRRDLTLHLILMRARHIRVERPDHHRIKANA